MTEQKKNEQSVPATEELTAEQLEQVNGGVLIGLLLPAVQKVREAAMGDGSVVPSEHASLNFQKVK